MPGVASCAVANRAVFVWLADTMAAGAAAFRGCRTLQPGERMWRALYCARLILLGKSNLLGCKILVPANGGPRRRGVTALQELLINRFVTRPAIGRRDGGIDHKAIVIGPFLTR